AIGPHRHVRRIILCTRKIYYELLEHREAAGVQDVAIIRLEQLFPLRRGALEAVLASYPEGTPVWWVQEGPGNMGPWFCLRIQFGETLFGRWPFSGVSRPPSASPAAGSHRRHKQEQTDIINRAFEK